MKNMSHLLSGVLIVHFLLKKAMLNDVLTIHQLLRELFHRFAYNHNAFIKSNTAIISNFLLIKEFSV